MLGVARWAARYSPEAEKSHGVVDICEKPNAAAERPVFSLRSSNSHAILIARTFATSKNPLPRPAKNWLISRALLSAAGKIRLVFFRPRALIIQFSLAER
jgi:hypothetical protein